jgi:hypothetical protein
MVAHASIGSLSAMMCRTLSLVSAPGHDALFENSHPPDMNLADLQMSDIRD